MSLYFILGPAEERELDEISRRFITANNINASVIADKRVSNIARLLKASSLHIGNDSGITHLASALGTRTLAIFGPTDPRIWGPFGRDVTIVTPKYPCAPCQEEKRRRCSVSGCLDAVKIDDVLLAAKMV